MPRYALGHGEVSVNDLDTISAVVQLSEVRKIIEVFDEELYFDVINFIKALL